MPILLDLVYAILIVLASPILAWRALREGKYRQGWREKLFGRVPRRPGNETCIWFHAVSVGEVKLLRPLIEEIGRRYPEWEVRISCTTSTGLQVARADYGDLVTFFAPLDFSWAVRRAMARVRPTMLVLVELELWPNLIHAAKKAGARVAIVNGRLSEHSFRGYSKIRWAIGSTLRRLDLVAAQTDEYAQRFVQLGTLSETVRVTGSIKYDGLEADRGNPRTIALRRALGISASDVVFVAGSTMDGEEVAALEAYQVAKARHPRLRLILVPRHKERFDAVAKSLAERGAVVLRRSELAGQQRRTIPGDAVILVDTLGELSDVWGLADIAFVGGSLFPGRGGQNMMEPAAYGAAVHFGPYTSNFKDAVEGLLACQGAKRLEGPGALAQALLQDLDEPDVADARASAGRHFVLAQHGAAARTMSELARLGTPSAIGALTGSRA